MRLRRNVAIALATVVAGALPLAAAAPPAGAAVPTDVFLSEYIEGSGFNKAVEIFNGTGAAVDLAAGGYRLELYSNGAAAPSQSAALTGTVADGDVYVVSRADADPAIVAQADQLAPAVANWNGNDAIVLRKGGAAGPAVDVFGQVGRRPRQRVGDGGDHHRRPHAAPAAHRVRGRPRRHQPVRPRHRVGGLRRRTRSTASAPTLSTPAAATSRSS